MYKRQPALKEGLSKEEMRAAIQQERRVEFNCEGIRFHDPVSYTHLDVYKRQVIDQHVFRSPALIVADDHQTLILIPDVDVYKRHDKKKSRWEVILMMPSS